jgi:hypothetical protein
MHNGQTGENINHDSACRWSRTRRLILSVAISAAMTLITFWVLVTHHHPYQYNSILAPGAIIALVIGVITHYERPLVWIDPDRDELCVLCGPYLFACQHRGTPSYKEVMRMERPVVLSDNIRQVVQTTY